MAELVKTMWVSNFGLVQPQNKKPEAEVIVIDKPDKKPQKPIVFLVVPEHKKPYHHIFVTPKPHKNPYELALLRHAKFMHLIHQLDKLNKYKHTLPHIKVDGEKYYVKTIPDPFSKDGRRKVVDINGKIHNVIEIKDPRNPQHNINIVVIKNKIHIVRGNMDFLDLKIKDYVA